jgi:hypothetical protein
MFKILAILLIQTIFIRAQELPVVHIVSFEYKNLSAAVKCEAAYSALRASLSGTGRVRIYSAKAWEKIFSTQKMILTISDFRDMNKAMEFGEVSPVDYIIVGESSADYEIVIDLINLHSGIIEKTFTLNAGGDIALQTKNITDEIIKIIVKDGSVSGKPFNGGVVLSAPELCGWKNGDEFFIVNSLNYPYARVRINSIKGSKAEAEILYNKDIIRGGDKAVFCTNFREKIRIRPRAVLLPIETFHSIPDKNLLFMNVRQIIFDSNKFELLDQSGDGNYYSFKISIQKSLYEQIYIVSMTVKKYPQAQTIFLHKLECTENDLKKGVNFLTALSLNEFYRRVLISGVKQGQVTLDEGQNYGIRKGLLINFKEPGNKEILGSGKITAVYANYAVAGVQESGLKLRPGCYAEFAQPELDPDELQTRINKIAGAVMLDKENSDKLAAKQQKKREEEMEKYRREQEKKEKAKRRSMILKARIRIGAAYMIMEDKIGKENIDMNKSSRLDADIYFGKHPYFNFVLNYGYVHFAYINKDGFLYANSAAAGVKVQLPLFSVFKIYGIALVRYVFYNSRSSDDAGALYPEQFESIYSHFRAGLDVVVSQGISFYLEGGRQRIIKSDIKAPEYYTAAAGLAFWF